MGIKHRQMKSLFGADDVAGWICYVDRRNGYAYAKKFTCVTGVTYPDSGTSIAVYTESQ